MTHFKLKRLILLFLFCASTQASALQINLNFVDTNHLWADWQKREAEQAKNIALARFDRADVVACVKNNYKAQWVRDVPREDGMPWNYQNWRTWVNWGMDVMRTNVGVTIDVYLKNHPKPNTWGSAPVGNFLEFVKSPQGTSIRTPRGRPYMWLDSKHFDENVESMAGVFWHEYLHLAGHDHPNGYNDENWITLYGDCVGNNGVYRSRNITFLTDTGDSFPSCE